MRHISSLRPSKHRLPGQPRFFRLTHTHLTFLRMRSVVCLSSVMHHTGCTDWESSAVGHPKRRGSTYADSKLAMVLFAKVGLCLVQEGGDA